MSPATISPSDAEPVIASTNRAGRPTIANFFARGIVSRFSAGRRARTVSMNFT